MYLKGIVTSGFKSFADKLELKLDGKITCIVGPNGSGKSNVVDAVRWVLGEQSVKSLRGDGSMSDVIFSGSKSRNPLNVASVELIFDNSDHYLNVPYTEISIKRRVYRSGENEYYLNNEKCRLKDINNLLLDTGMGKESFNIISQGEVDKILSNSSADRRVIFEEASGILKYKKRKEEALKKLDKTHSNIDRVNDIITELEMQVGPLKEQSEKAKEYLENKKGLDKYEVALLAYDIENFNIELENSKKRKEKIDSEIVTISNETNKNDAKYIEDNNRLEKLELERTELNRELLKVTEEKTKLEGERNLLKEKSKTTKEDEELKEEIRNLINKREKLQSSISVIDVDIQEIVKDMTTIDDNIKEQEKSLQNEKSKKNMLTNDFSKHNQELISIKHKMDNLKIEIEQGSDMPNSVRKVLKNTNLTGIHNTIGNILSTEEQYVNALNTAISSNKNFIITKDEDSAKKAINYLKDSHLGRATFFPMTVIKERYVDYETLSVVRNSPDFVGVMSDLVTYNRQYEAIIKNQLGTVLVATNLDAATRLSHLINSRYKIVSLSGDVVNVGGSLTGGSNYAGKSAIVLKQELKHLEDTMNLLQREEEEIEKELQENREEISKLEDSLFIISKDKVTLKEKYDTKKNELRDIKDKLIQITKDYEALESISNNSISKKEEEIIRQFHEKTAYKEQIEIRIKSITKDINDIKDRIEKNQADDKLKNSHLRSLEKESHDLEVNINRIDVKLDNMLETLSQEYEMTYERAKNEYSLDIEPEDARVKVNTFRTNIKALGNGFYQHDYAAFWTLRMLFLVEWATWDGQSVIENTATYSDSVSYRTGKCDSMTYHTGLSADGYNTQYRYVEDPWENYLEWMDGLYFSGSSFYVINNPANFATGSNGTRLGTRSTSEGYISSWTIPSNSNYNWALIPSSVVSSESYTMDEYYYTSSGTIPYIGGTRSSWGAHGPFFIYTDFTASSTNSLITSRLMYLPS